MITMTTSPAGWYPQSDGSQRYWDGAAWTNHVAEAPGKATHFEHTADRDASSAPVSRERLAHDLTMTYLNNRYGAKVVGEFSVNADQDWSTTPTSVTDVTGRGEVRTEALPHVNKLRTQSVEVKTGGRHLFGIGPEKVARIEVEVQPREYEVDATFTEIISDYFAAYSRFLALLPR